MKQHELESFVSELAKAEEAAAKVIGRERSTSLERLEKLKQGLQKQDDQAIASLKIQFSEDKKLQIQSVEEMDQQMNKETRLLVSEMQQRHDGYIPEITAWAVKRVVEP